MQSIKFPVAHNTIAKKVAEVWPFRSNAANKFAIEPADVLLKNESITESFARTMLGAFYQNYCSGTVCAAKKTFGRDCFDSLCNCTETSDIRLHLLPQIKDRWSIERVRLSGGASQLSYLPIADVFCIVVQHDSEGSQNILNDNALQERNLPFGHAYDAARINLSKRSHHEFEAICDNDTEQPIIYSSTWHDEYDAARILLTDKIERLKVHGNHVILLLNNNRVLVTGSESDLGLAIAFSELSAAQDDPRPLPPVPLTLKNGRLVRYRLPADNIWHVMFDDLELHYMAHVYQAQKRILESQPAHADHEIGTFRLQKNESSNWCSFSLIRKGRSPILLPKTDFVHFERDAECSEERVVRAPWHRLIAVMGDSVQRNTHAFPERHLLTRRPTPAELRLLAQPQHLPVTA